MPQLAGHAGHREDENTTGCGGMRLKSFLRVDWLAFAHSWMPNCNPNFVLHATVGVRQERELQRFAKFLALCRIDKRRVELLLPK